MKWLARVLGVIEHQQKTETVVSAFKSEFDERLAALKADFDENVAAIRNDASKREQLLEQSLRDELESEVKHLQMEVNFLHLSKRDAPGVVGSRPVKS
jgi:hypothetical protein